MRPQILETIHEGHLGIEKCKRRARKAVYWPGMNEAIKQKVARCTTCQIHHYQQKKEPLMPTIEAAANMPWGMVGVDLFALNGRDYLLMNDYCSNFPETCLLTSTTSASVILQMKSIFARHGIPLVVRTEQRASVLKCGICRVCKRIWIQAPNVQPVLPKIEWNGRVWGEDG